MTSCQDLIMRGHASLLLKGQEETNAGPAQSDFLLKVRQATAEGRQTETEPLHLITLKCVLQPMCCGVWRGGVKPTCNYESLLLCIPYVHVFSTQKQPEQEQSKSDDNNIGTNANGNNSMCICDDAVHRCMEPQANSQQTTDCTIRRALTSQ